MSLHGKDDSHSNKHTNANGGPSTSDLTSTLASNVVVNPGACFLGDELIHCALEERACHGKLFRSHRELLGTPHERKCSGLFSSHQGDHIGMCASDLEQFVCTGHTSNCALPYADHVSYCNLQYNHFPKAKVPFALYGKCMPFLADPLKKKLRDDAFGGTCVWSIDDCPEEGDAMGNYTYVPAFQQVSFGAVDYNQFDYCTCDKVKVGACVHSPSDYFACAVSEESCDPESKFKTWQELEAMGRVCRLCDSFDKSSPVEKWTSLDGHQETNVEGNQCNLAGASIGGIVAGAAFTLVVLWMVQYWRKKTQQARFDSNGSGDDTTFKDGIPRHAASDTTSAGEGASMEDVRLA